MTSTATSAWQWVGDNSTLASVVELIKRADWVAVDTEFRRRDTFYPQVALVQLATAQGCWLIDPLTLKDATPLVELLRCPSVIKVLHSASEDLEVFEHWLGCLPTPLFDSQKAAAMIGRGFGLSYQALVAMYLAIEVGKEETQSDWLARPLSDAQLQYAAQDVTYLAQLYPALLAQVAERGRLDWILDEGERAETGGRGPLAKFKSAWKLSVSQQSALVKLVQWRETQARQRDKPRSWILTDKTINALVQRKPTSVRELAAVDGVGQGLVRRAGEALVNLINSAPDADFDKVSATFTRPAAGSVKSVAKQLSPVLESMAAALGVNVEIALPSRELELIARIAAGEAYEQPRHWQGWRQQHFVVPLLAQAQTLLAESTRGRVLMKLVEVFKSSNKAETYLYLERGTAFADLPDGLRTVFGAPQSVLSLKLTPERQLARYTGAEVLEAIEKQGFFLQLPPENCSSDEREQMETRSC